MMLNLRQGTAITDELGPFVDDTDGKTFETALTIQKAHVKLSKNGGTKAAANSDQGTADAGAPYDANGDYKIALDTTDTNTLGRLRVSIAITGALTVTKDYMVIPANVYDAMVGDSDKLQVDAVEVAGEGVTAMAELTTDPGATPSLVKALMLLFMALRNKVTQTATEQKIHKSDGTNILTATCSDNGTTTEKGKFG